MSFFYPDFNAPNSKDRSDIRLSDGGGFRITGTISRGKDPVITRNKVVN